MNWYLSDDTVNNAIYSESSDHFQQNYYNNCTTCHGGPYVSNSRTRLRRSDHSSSEEWGFSIMGYGYISFIVCEITRKNAFWFAMNLAFIVHFLWLYEDLIALIEVRLLLKTKLVRNIWDVSICTLLANPTQKVLFYYTKSTFLPLFLSVLKMRTMNL